MATASQPKKQQRTAVIYFGSGRETYLNLVQAEDSSKFLSFIQQPLQMQLGAEKHRVGCSGNTRYTGLVLREGCVQGWLGEREVVPICRVRCCCCRAVFTPATQFQPTLPPPRQ